MNTDEDILIFWISPLPMCITIREKGGLYEYNNIICSVDADFSDKIHLAELFQPLGWVTIYENDWNSSIDPQRLKVILQMGPCNLEILF